MIEGEKARVSEEKKDEILGQEKELDESELESVTGAGGCACVAGGSGKGEKLNCICCACGVGKDHKTQGEYCVCPLTGVGKD